MFDPEHIFRELMCEALAAGSARQWRKRAAEFRAARPTPGDYPGQQTLEQRRAKWHELTAVANACEVRARFIELGYEDWSEVDDVMAEQREAA